MRSLNIWHWQCTLYTGIYKIFNSLIYPIQFAYVKDRIKYLFEKYLVKDDRCSDLKYWRSFPCMMTISDKQNPLFVSWDVSNRLCKLFLYKTLKIFRLKQKNK